MSTKVRKQIYIERRQEKLIKREAKAYGISEGELIRRRIDRNEESGTWGGDDPAAFDSIVRYARRRLAKAKREGRAGGGRTWKRDDLYEERFARYDKHSTR